MLALLRLEEAQILAANGHPEGALYLAGYSIELALKAKIAERLGLPWPTESEFLKYKVLIENWNEGLRYQLPEPINNVDVTSFLTFLTAPKGFLQWIETS